MRPLVKLLRDNGFNTFCSCGHYPNPYIQIEWYSDEDITRLWTLLTENNYANWVIKATWAYDPNFIGKSLEMVFYPPSGGTEGLAKEEDLRRSHFDAP